MTRRKRTEKGQRRGKGNRRGGELVREGRRIVRQDGANCKVNYDIFAKTLLISGAESSGETFVIVPSSPPSGDPLSSLSLSLLSLPIFFLFLHISLLPFYLFLSLRTVRPREPRKIKLRVSVTDVRGRNEWTMRATALKLFATLFAIENRDKETLTRGPRPSAASVETAEIKFLGEHAYISGRM